MRLTNQLITKLNEELMYPTKFFNTLNFIRFPNHCFKLKDNDSYAAKKHKSVIKNMQWNNNTYYTLERLNDRSKNNLIVMLVQKYLSLKQLLQQKDSNWPYIEKKTIFNKSVLYMQ